MMMIRSSFMTSVNSQVLTTRKCQHSKSQRWHVLHPAAACFLAQLDSIDAVPVSCEPAQNEHMPLEKSRRDVRDYFGFPVQAGVFIAENMMRTMVFCKLWPKQMLY